MRIEIQHPNKFELLSLLLRFTDMTTADIATTIECSHSAEVVVAFFWGEALLGVLMLRPITLLSDAVFAWLVTTPEVDQHKVAVGRMARLCVQEVQARGKRIVSFCTDRPSSIRWIASLGARFGQSTKGAIPYIIELPS